MPRMTEEQLAAVLDHEVTDSVLWHNSTIREEQERNLQYYLGLPMGNEVEGRSQVLSWDVFEAVEAALPGFIEPFFSGDNIGEFIPNGIEDEAFATQATDYVNWIIKQQNPGFLVFLHWIKDALISKIGIVNADWVKVDPKRGEYRGLTTEQAAMMLEDPRNEVVEHASYPMPIPGIEGLNEAQMMQQYPTGVPMLHDLVVLTKKPGRVELDNVRPEHFIVSRGVGKLEDCKIIGEIVRYTRSDLKEMGYSGAETVQSYDFHQLTGATIDALRDDEVWSLTDTDSPDTTLEEVSLFKGFIRADFNGDGVAEWRKVLRGGSTFLENEEYDCPTYCVITPIPIPHRIVGMAYADPAAEIQKIKTGLTRQYLDSLYLANNPRTYVNMEAQVKIDDLLSQRIGGIVRGKGPANLAVQPLVTTNVSRDSLEGIQYADGMKETRLGLTRYNQGLDPDVLNKAAYATVSKVMGAADKRQLLTLRVMAETGIKDLFRVILKLITKYQDVASTIKMRNEWVNFNPSEWSDQMDVDIQVGLGSGDRIEAMSALQMFAQYMIQAAQAGVVLPKNVYEFGKMLAKAAKIKGAEELLLTQPPDEPPEPGPDPEVLKEQAKAEAMLQAKQVDAQVTMQVETQKAQLEQQKLQGQLEVQAANDARDAERARMQAEMDAQLEAQKAELQAALERERLAFDRWKVEQEIAFKVWQTQYQAGVQAEQFAMQKQVDMTMAENKANERPAGA